uniref:Protein transport protein Sec61 subunit beta n=1 Tax=Onchocerca volvulus TaxID=6282 RepID=A0A8R1TKJ9_ONCVO
MPDECYFDLESSNMPDTGRCSGHVVLRAGFGRAIVRQKRSGPSAGSGRSARRAARSLWHFYTKETARLEIGPVPVLVFSLVFIASVFMLHIWSKYNRSHR